ncbi:metal ABC transporter ATP-binding protein [Snodgrassella sp. CFCC 13594]|uniref:metal ABC transporter ATP-binding protein n=1 Tax=Snodgrassella sp. CFCC 13594 TaxID=1775559 RepID=UPI000B0A30FF|nr:metal ABC transporter ATP-binding protein [Snodgrassella sp. CFCC 13594]
MGIAIDNLTVSYRHRPAVHHVSADFGDNQMWALFGPNGAGKSTLLKAIMGLLKADTGRIDWHGLQRADIAYLPQQSDIDRSQPLSVYELTAMGLWYEIGYFKGLTPALRARIQAALKQVDMLDYARRPIGQLSNGQFQRILFARMLAQNARVLLLDEPFNAVDARTTYALLDILREHQQRQHCTVIAVLHDYEQVRAYFPHTLLLAREKIAAGKTEVVLTDAYLQRAADAMQQHDSNEWCAA